VRNPCPNCGGDSSAIVGHSCCDDNGRGGDHLLGITHCGCFYEGSPAAVVSHVSRDCRCARLEAENQAKRMRAKALHLRERAAMLSAEAAALDAQADALGRET
jgi:hypothetical protein